MSAELAMKKAELAACTDSPILLHTNVQCLADQPDQPFPYKMPLGKITAF